MNFDDILVVIVLYKSDLAHSDTVKTLGNSFELNSKIDLLVYDHSPNRQYESNRFEYANFSVQYVHDSSNSGLSTAYNYAYQLAIQNKKSWLLLLDQDTFFTKKYLEEIIDLDIDRLVKKPVAILPRINSLDNSQVISPSKMFLGGICRPIRIESGIVDSKITGINSGTILSTAYLNEINGFTTMYTLDMLDHWYFKKIFEDKECFYLLEATINQDLSVIENFEKNVSLVRYKQMLKSEVFFMKSERFFDRFVFKLRLFLRVRKQINFENKEYYKFTLKNIFNL